METDNRKGITLIELLIVIVILAALAAIALPKIAQSSRAAKINTCRNNIEILNAAIERYYFENESFPPDLHAISKDENVFPDGQPICPITGNTYPRWLNDKNHVKDSGHSH